MNMYLNRMAEWSFVHWEIIIGGVPVSSLKDMYLNIE